jgi:hypothetical protein
LSIGPFKRRSSLPSSFVTGLIGWIGLYVIVALVMGEANLAGRLLSWGLIAAIVQIALLRLAFFVLGLHRGKLLAALWGGLSGALIVLAESKLTTIFATHLRIWIADGAYIGIVVGLFLRYFFLDDQRIVTEARTANHVVDYGRDARWLEPFFFGAVAYTFAFLPTSLNLAGVVLVVGAISGVAAAGASHFIIFSESRASLLPIFLGVVIGCVQGVLTGLLFRAFAPELLLSPLVHGAIGGGLTYLVTTIRGRNLAMRESVA